MSNSAAHRPDIAIFGAGIAGLWTFHRLKKLGYDVVLFEKNEIGCGQTIASQGIIHSGLKFSLSGKTTPLVNAMSHMPQRWRDAFDGCGDVDLSHARRNTESQHLLIPKGFIGGITKIVTKKMLGESVRDIPFEDLAPALQHSGFRGHGVFMNEPVLDIPSVIEALSAPYRDAIKQINEAQAFDPFEFLEAQNIKPKRIIFTSAAGNETIATTQNDHHDLATQHRPLMQIMIKNAPFPLFAHLVGASDKPVASITTHYTLDGACVWYIGGGVAERDVTADQDAVFRDTYKALKSYMKNIDLSGTEWAVLPIQRVEGRSKTAHWMPDSPTLHKTDNALYCWPTKLTFAPMLSDMILEDVQERGVMPSQNTTHIEALQNAAITQSPWDTASWTPYEAGQNHAV